MDCVWGDWKPGKCSKTCAGGKRTKVRAPKVKASLGSMESFEGKDCQGISTILEECNTFHCPGINWFNYWEISDYLTIWYIINAITPSLKLIIYFSAL